MKYQEFGIYNALSISSSLTCTLIRNDETGLISRRSSLAAGFSALEIRVSSYNSFRHPRGGYNGKDRPFELQRTSKAKVEFTKGYYEGSLISDVTKGFPMSVKTRRPTPSESEKSFRTANLVRATSKAIQRGGNRVNRMKGMRYILEGSIIAKNGS